MAVISHWGVEIESDFPELLEDPAWELLQPHLLDAFTKVEQRDLVVAKANLRLEQPNTIVIHVSSQDQSQGFTPFSALHKISCCPECKMPWGRKLHPENGCPYGIIDHVMST